MEIKEILKALEKLKENKDKVKYLKEIINKIKDKNLVNEIKELIEELEDNLETKLDNTQIPTARQREIELDEVESDIEVQERKLAPQKIIRPDINLRNIEEEREVRYENNNISYQSTKSTTPVYQTNASFATYESMAQQNAANIRMVEQELIKEDIISFGQPISDVQKERIRDTIERFIPNASPEERIQAENQILYDIKSKDKDLKYISKLK